MPTSAMNSGSYRSSNGALINTSFGSEVLTRLLLQRTSRWMAGGILITVTSHDGGDSRLGGPCFAARDSIGSENLGGRGFLQSHFLRFLSFARHARILPAE